MKSNRYLLSLFVIVSFTGTLFSCLDTGPDIPSYEEQLQRDIAAIDSYLAGKNITPQIHSSGLRYVIHRDVTGKRPTIDSCVTAAYEGRLMSNEQKFDGSSSASFPLGGVIEGWRIGIPLLDEGDSATLYIPSVMGYGYYGYQPTIPSNANLIFHVAVKKVGSTYNSSNRSCN